MRGLGFVAWIIASFPGGAGESPTHIVRLNPEVFATYSDVVRTNHPGLRAVGAIVEAARAARDGIRSIADPNLNAGASFSSSRGPRSSDDGNLAYGLEQKLPVFGKEVAARDRAGAEAQQASVGYEATFQEMRLRANQALIALALAEHEADLIREENEWHALESRTARARYEAGQGTPLEVLRFESEHAQQRAALLRVEQVILAARGNVNRSLGRSPEAILPRFALPDLVPPPTYSPTLVAHAFTSSPTIRKLTAERRTAERTVEVTRRSSRPDLSLGFENSHYSGDGGFRQAVVGFSLNLPWFNGDAYRKDMDRDKARLKSVAAELDDVQLAVQEEIFRAATSATTARSEGQTEKDEVVPHAQAAFEAALVGWTSGRTMLSELFETRRAWVDARVRLAKATATEWEALNDMAYLCGFDLVTLLRQNPSTEVPASTPIPNPTSP